ncbi:MAG TPA: LamG domain-containing protein [Verrucomicrobiota bacterium]|nr:LamG domain-containing protein [Verrucomicrobiota bacterium]
MATPDRFGRDSNALQSDGSTSYVQTPFTPSAQPGDSITVTAWIRSDADTSSNPRVFGLERGNSQELRVMLRPSGVADSFFRDGNNIAASVDSSTPVNDGAWHHLVGIRDGSSSQVRIYVDGRLEAEAPDPTSAAMNTDEPRWLAIGANNHASSLREYFKGTIDDVRIYNRALSAWEVRALDEMPGWDDRLALADPVSVVGGMIRLDCGRVDGQPISPGDLNGYALQTSSDRRTWTDTAAQPALENGKMRFETAITADASVQFFRVVRP